MFHAGVSSRPFEFLHLQHALLLPRKFYRIQTAVGLGLYYNYRHCNSGLFRSINISIVISPPASLPLLLRFHPNSLSHSSHFDIQTPILLITYVQARNITPLLSFPFLCGFMFNARPVSQTVSSWAPSILQCPTVEEFNTLMDIMNTRVGPIRKPSCFMTDHTSSL